MNVINDLVGNQIFQVFVCQCNEWLAQNVKSYILVCVGHF